MPPRPRILVSPSHRLSSHSLHPRAFQLQCRRLQSSSSSKDPKQPPDSVEAPSTPKLEAMHRAPPPQPSQSEIDAHYAANPNLLLMQLQNAQRQAQQRKFETPSTFGRMKNDGEQDKSFHPALAGFIAGLMVAFGISYTVYHLSGSYHVQKASQAENKGLGEEQKRIAILATALAVAEASETAADESELSAHEIADWLRRATVYYSTFQPNSKDFVQARTNEINKGMGHREKAKEVESIAKECAVELEKEVGPRNLYQNTISGLVTGRTGWHIIMKHLMRIEEAVEGKDFVEKRRQRVAKGIIDEQ